MHCRGITNSDVDGARPLLRLLAPGPWLITRTDEEKVLGDGKGFDRSKHIVRLLFLSNSRAGHSLIHLLPCQVPHGSYLVNLGSEYAYDGSIPWPSKSQPAPVYNRPDRRKMEQSCGKLPRRGPAGRTAWHCLSQHTSWLLHGSLFSRRGDCFDCQRRQSGSRKDHVGVHTLREHGQSRLRTVHCWQLIS